MTYPLLASLLLELELLERLRASGLERLEFLLLEGPLVGDPGVLLDLFPLASLAFLLGLLALLAVVLFHLAQHLVLLLQRDAPALALLASLHHLADACRGGVRKEPAALRWRGESVGAREGRLRPQWLGGVKERGVRVLEEGRRYWIGLKRAPLLK